MRLVSLRFKQTRTIEKKNRYTFKKAKTEQKERTSRIKSISLTHKSDSRSSSLHSLVQNTTFLSQSFNKKSINKMLATATNNSNQFNSNKTFNTFTNKQNRREFSSNNNFNKNSNNNKMIPNKNTHRQIIPMHHKKSNPIQIRSNQFQQVSYQNSELTVNLTNNEPRIVIFNNNLSNTSNQMNYNSLLPNNNNNYRESKFFTTTTSHFNNNTNKLFHHSSKQRQQIQQADSVIGASNCNNNLSKFNLVDSYYNNYKNKIAVPSSAGFKRFNSRFKYVNKSAILSKDKNTAPYNTTQYIMFDYSRRRPHDQECPNEQQSFTDEWNMALAAAAAAATSTAEDSTKQTSFNNTSIINDNLNEFSLDEETSAKQLSLSDHNLNLIEEDEEMLEEEEEIHEQNQQRMQHLSSSL